ncbi:hypothetical protein SBA5_970007 [Candidatus Sulfotelmatomonas gaucii]|uniref:Uncharacterized protein n=1 Tax=Candidatus Sulfuritelmatomonas gaucii TaxID=2043161 RepID=A0A2N9MA48_9BACT|nr:hypothetical protein SBA5_970007 [Candidatus Sulfotelmatomonas gaucii]
MVANKKPHNRIGVKWASGLTLFRSSIKNMRKRRRQGSVRFGRLRPEPCSGSGWGQLRR